jgi:protein-tyrosine sulfotransferase
MKPLVLAKLVNRVTFGRVKYGWWTAPWVSDESPIVIGAADRSGTTLLTELLGAHRDICMAPETGILANNRRFERLCAPGMTADRVRRLFHESATVGEFFERYNTALMEHAGKRRWGEKTPANVHNAAVLFRFFPKARFIHPIRDGRDVVCSMRTHPKYRWVDGGRVETGAINPWGPCIDRWVKAVTRGLELRNDARYREVRYEALVTDPDGTLREILRWLDMPWDLRMVENYRTDRHALQPRLTEPIDQTAVQRWRRELPPEARHAFRGAANDLLITLGYASDDSWIDDSNPALPRAHPPPGDY